MSKHSLNIAVKYGESLREFHDQSEAEDYYISYKDDLLNRLKAISTQASAFFPDYTIESLKKLENWYFNLYEKQSFDKAGSTQEDFESMMSVYWGEVVIKNNEDAKWVVMEYPFSQKRSKPAFTIFSRFSIERFWVGTLVFVMVALLRFFHYTGRFSKGQ